MDVEKGPFQKESSLSTGSVHFHVSWWEGTHNNQKRASAHFWLGLFKSFLASSTVPEWWWLVNAPNQTIASFPGLPKLFPANYLCQGKLSSGLKTTPYLVSKSGTPNGAGLTTPKVSSPKTEPLTHHGLLTKAPKGRSLPIDVSNPRAPPPVFTS